MTVSFTDDLGHNEAGTSDATATVSVCIGEQQGDSSDGQKAPPPTNNAATGKPTITGTAQVGQTLTAGTSDIEDDDGLDDVTWSYQWLRGDTDITDATSSTYTLVAADQGITIKVKVSFDDDLGNAEARTSDATAAVAAAPVPLTVTLGTVAASHNGANTTFTFHMSFSEEPHEDFSYKTLRDHVFTVTGGTVKNANRLNRPSNIGWNITRKPDGDADVRIQLPVTTDCEAQGAVCTGDGRKLSNSLDFSVAKAE